MVQEGKLWVQAVTAVFLGRLPFKDSFSVSQFSNKFFGGRKGPCMTILILRIEELVQGLYLNCQVVCSGATGD